MDLSGLIYTHGFKSLLLRLSLHSIYLTVKKGVLLCTLSLTHLMFCSLVVMVTFDYLHSIHDNQCLTHQI